MTLPSEFPGCALGDLGGRRLDHGMAASSSPILAGSAAAQPEQIEAVGPFKLDVDHPGSGATASVTSQLPIVLPFSGSNADEYVSDTVEAEIINGALVVEVDAVV